MHQLNRIAGCLAGCDRHLEQYSGNLAWPVLLAEVRDCLDAQEASVGVVLEHYRDVDSVVFLQRTDGFGLVDGDRGLFVSDHLPTATGVVGEVVAGGELEAQSQCADLAPCQAQWLGADRWCAGQVSQPEAAWCDRFSGIGYTGELERTHD